MAWQFPVASLPPLLAAIAEVLLAILLLRSARGRRATLALALLLVASASASTLIFVIGGFTGTYETAVAITFAYAFWTIAGFLWLGFGAMLLAERARVPRALSSFATYLLPALVLAGWALARPDLVYDFTPYLSAPLAADAPQGSFPFSHPQALTVPLGILDLMRPLMAGLLAWWALRRESTEEWASILLVAIAAAGSYLINAAAIVEPTRADMTLFAWIARALLAAGAAVSLAVFLFLLHEGWRGHDERRRLARAGAATLLLMALAGIGVSLANFSDPLVFAAFLALGALPFPLIATYALLRHRLLGLDVKVRFAISRSTIAAAFIAVFFVASEGAQIVFGQGNEWIGLLGAGALVFALAPLQRAAERLAERAVPVAGQTTPNETAGGPGAEAIYLDALRVAVRGTRLTREDEVRLHRLAARLGLDAGRAHELLAQAERETGSGSMEAG